jgi:hypothetical protein
MTSECSLCGWLMVQKCSLMICLKFGHSSCVVLRCREFIKPVSCGVGGSIIEDEAEWRVRESMSYLLRLRVYDVGSTRLLIRYDR